MGSLCMLQLFWIIKNLNKNISSPKRDQQVIYNQPYVNIYNAISKQHVYIITKLIVVL